MHRKTLFAALAAALAFGSLGATAALADDAGSVTLQTPAFKNFDVRHAPVPVTRGTGLFGPLFAPGGTGALPDEEDLRSLRGDYDDRN